MKKIIAIALCVFMVLSMMTVSVLAEGYELMSDVYVSANGEERAAGTADAPTSSIARAMVAVRDGGTIHIDGTILVPEGFSFNKNVTIVGDNKATDVLDLSALSSQITLEANVCFDYVTLKFGSNYELYANGYELVVGENCATAGTVAVYGGAYGRTIDGGTSVTLLSGDYIAVYGGGNLGAIFGNTNVVVGGTADVHNDSSTEYIYHIYGGGYGSEVNGNTYVWVGGNANPGCTWTEHERNLYYVFGGGYNCQINGSTTVVLADNAEANYIYGGMCGSNTTITGGSNVYITGGYSMSVNGGSLGCDQGAGYQETSKINVVMTGGTIQQLFGASKDADFTGIVNIRLLRGEIQRRVFGGCYNETNIISWSSQNSVIGKITLVIAEKEYVTLSLNVDSDNALSAHSRRQSVASGEEGVVVFTSTEAQRDYSGDLDSSVAGGNAYDGEISIKALLPGDLNYNDQVESTEIVSIFRHVYDASTYGLIAPVLADADGDGNVTNADLLAIVQG